MRREPALAHSDDNHRSDSGNFYSFRVHIRKSWLDAALDYVFYPPQLNLHACDAQRLYFARHPRGIAVLVALVGDAEDDVPAGCVCKRRYVCEKLGLLIPRVNGDRKSTRLNSSH